MATATSRTSDTDLPDPKRGARLTLGSRIVLSFGALFVLMLAMAAISYTWVRVMDDEALSMGRDSVPGLYLATTLRATANSGYSTLERALFVDSDDDATKRDLDRLPPIMRQFDQVSAEYQATLFRDQDRAHFRDFKAAWDQYLPQQHEAMRLAATAKPDAQAAFIKLAPAWNNVQRTANELVTENRGQADDSAKAIRDSVTSMEITLATALGVTLLVALVTGYSLYRAITVPMSSVVEVHNVIRTGNLTQRLRLGRRDEFGALEDGFNRMAEELNSLVAQAQKSSLQVTTSVAEIAATSREQHATASETAATTAGIGAASREIAAASRDLSHAMNELSVAAGESAMRADTSRSGLAPIEATMRSAMEAANSLNAKLAILSEKTVNINRAIATIAKVANQSDLLSLKSLNAATEAEKVGEHSGRFAVVVAETRRVADQAAIAAHDIEHGMNEIQSAVAACVTGMGALSEEVRHGMHDVQLVSGQLSQIIHDVQTLAPRVQLVNEGMQTQAASAGQIMQALSQLSETAQLTAESLRQSSQAIDDLTLVANQLRTGVSRFKIEG
ncbi:methyl-accepting chemotaxis protein [Paraburkholderia diazotrophica]|uniref:Methyl-accepting chemotaxis protein WspA n=1 Tax=Paraburkholderia diazotrophica TaxID=667676 RepID=A0A1H6WCK7_9BURK|nr:methyl-accepting chemotaxis protein [Paraburkholderia diazotrophica]SEJ10055.1 methyl-accepting chemotaxis protein WspA [Paraburkholderia diazotrophica]